MTVGGYQLYNY